MGQSEIVKTEQGAIEQYRQRQTSIEESRATAESQAGFLVAKQFPRNEDLAVNRILNSCRRIGLARDAEYAFPKGGQTVMGPSVRLAEAVAQNWGNIQFGIRELEVGEDSTVMMAYCFDLETNTRAERIFEVKHYIKTKQGMKELDDPRDLYELKFNMGSRRKRACILEVIPGDVVELAVEACRATLESEGEDASPENIAKMVDVFGKIGVTKEMIELRQGKKVEALVASEVGMLRKIYQSIKDGMSNPEKWFGESTLEQPQRKEKEKEKPKKKKKSPTKIKKEATEPAQEEPQGAQEPGGAPEPPPGDPEPPPAQKAEQEPVDEDLPLGGKMVKPDENRITDKIASVKFVTEGQSQKGPWKLYNVATFNGTKLACFDEQMVKVAEDAMDNEYLCEIFYKETPKGLTLLTIDVIG